MKQDKLTKKEQEWILEYKSTSEYEQIYGDDNKYLFNLSASGKQTGKVYA